VLTGALNQAVRRNHERFPKDFMFQLTTAEIRQLNLSQIVTGSEKHRDPRLGPYAFTEQGVAMLSSVLRSKRAVTVNIEIMRAFVVLFTELDGVAEESSPSAIPWPHHLSEFSCVSIHLQLFYI
jgi:ORF6N domain